MKTLIKRLLVAGYNHGVLRKDFVSWCFVKLDLRSV